MKTMQAIATTLVLLAAAAAAHAQTVTRGPYLQQGNESAVTVRWRTSTAVVGRVRYGTSLGSLSQWKDGTASTNNHEVRLTGLAPNTKYFYSVGTSGATLAGGDANHFFLTAPPPGQAKKTRVWVIGDAGTADANQRKVRDAYTTYTGSVHTDLWLMLGDNAYNDGTDAEYQAAVFDMYKPLLAKSVLWSTYGNHDGHTADSATQTGPYYDIFSKPTQGECGGLASGTEAYYSFDYGNVHFISLDSYETSRAAGGAMHTWAKNDANGTTRNWLIAFWHHPPYTKGSHNSDTESALVDMRKNFLPILEDAGVDLVLCGHSHSYERSYLVDGHYGASSTFTAAMKKDGGSGRDPNPYTKSAGLNPHQGTVYAVAGSSGKVSVKGTLDHPVMFVNLYELGSMVLDIDGNRLDAKFLREDGTVQDSFTIVKAGSTGGGSDTVRPTVVIQQPTTASTYASSSPDVTLSGSASDNVGVTRVEWSNAAGGSGVVNGTTAWSAALVLQPGANEITVTAYDAAGNSAVDTITITYGTVGGFVASGGSEGQEGMLGDRCSLGVVGSAPSAVFLSALFLAFAAGLRRRPAR